MRKIFLGLGVAALGLVFTAGSAFASSTISGNGAGSISSISVHHTTKILTSQTNSALFSNHITVSSSTGGNVANENTGGNTSISGGSADATLGVSNVANTNTNTSSAPCCLCDLSLGDQTILGNGASSINQISTKTVCISKLSQTNVATITNDLNVGTSTGNNVANGNTGGDVTVSSGDSSTQVTVSNIANSNSSL